jgi:hypothetical protein
LLDGLGSYQEVKSVKNRKGAKPVTFPSPIVDEKGTPMKKTHLEPNE